LFVFGFSAFKVHPSLTLNYVIKIKVYLADRYGFVTATKLGTTDKIFVAATKNFAAATKRFVDRTKYFVVVTKCFCYPYFRK